VHNQWYELPKAERDELEDESLRFTAGLLNALGFVAVLVLFGWFMWQVVPWLLTEVVK